MKLSVKPFTVLLLVGPTGCGKSTFVDKLLAEKDFEFINSGRGDTFDYPVRVLSSDVFRRNILLAQDYRGELHKHSSRMLEVSEQAFSQLISSLKIFTSFPVNCPLVIVDSRGFSEAFRDQVRKVAKDNGYFFDVVVFDYKKAKDYEEFLEPAEAAITAKDVAAFRRKVLPELRRKDFDKFTKVKSKSHFDKDSDFEFEMEDMELLKKCTIFNRPELPFAVIGDSHECVEPLQALIEKVFAKDPNTQIIHVGDYLDKGQNTCAMVDYMHSRALGGDLVVIGNHEQYVYRRLKGEISKADIEEEYFTAVKALEENEEHKLKFFEIFEQSLPFVKVLSDNSRTLYVTHAPCSNMYLGKLGFKAERAQRNLYIKDRERDIREEIRFVFDEAVANQPLHIFGHLPHSGANYVNRNKVFLDTGAVHGGKLSAFFFKNNFYEILSTPGKEIEGLVKELSDDLTRPIQVYKPFNIHDYDLTPDEHRFIRHTVKKGVKYISGTMAPAPSSSTELEPLKEAFSYYAKCGVKKVCLQPKYMGSRCQLYLFKDETEEKKSFAVSRNGYVIRHVENLDEEIQWWKNHFTELFGPDWEEVILDGELLPWSALGRSLIEREFYSYKDLVEHELFSLENDKEFAKLIIAQPFDIPGRKEELKIFSETLDLYGNPDIPLDFRAFNILSINGKVVNEESYDNFCFVNPNPTLIVELGHEGDISLAERYFHCLTVNEGMEGVVVKPLVEESDVLTRRPPEYLKVRNEKYLTLVYGYDYKRRYQKLVLQKNISGKVAISIRESKLGAEMLSANEDRLKELLVQMIGELKKEQTLDPRL